MDEGRLVIIQCSLAGISGDMFLSALVDAGVNQKKIINLLKLIPESIGGCELKLGFRRVTRKGIQAAALNVEITKDMFINFKEMRKVALKVLNRGETSNEAKKYCLETLRLLRESEKEVFGEEMENKFHMLHSVDTILDLVGVTLALQDLNVFERNTKFISTPVVVGEGRPRTLSGEFYPPHPVVLSMLTRFRYPFYTKPVEHELSTPTGVALLVSLKPQVTNKLPPIKSIATGYGAGKMEFKAFPNVLRVIIGELFT